MRYLLVLLFHALILFGDAEIILSNAEMEYTHPQADGQVCALPQEWDLDCAAIQNAQKSYLDDVLALEDYDIFDTESTPEDTNDTNWFYYRDFLTGMDTFHEAGTQAVILMASGIDYGLATYFNEDENATQTDSNVTAGRLESGPGNQGVVIPTLEDDGTRINVYVKSKEGNTYHPKQIKKREYERAKQTYWMSQWFNMDAKNSEFLNLTDDSYVRIRAGYAYDYRGNGEFIKSITARLKIPRTRDKLDLIVGDVTKRSKDLNFDGTEDETDNSIALGVENLFGVFDVVKSRFRVGISSITDPYAKWILSHEMLYGPWFVEPTETVRYSVDGQLEEWTDLYMRRQTSSTALFSLFLQRSTKTGEPGMAYLVQPAHHHALGNKTTVTAYLGIYGRTEEFSEDESGYVPKKGIHTYSVGASWRRQSSRKYIVFDLQPIISFEHRYHFEPNYIFKASVEFYLGLTE